MGEEIVPLVCVIPTRHGVVNVALVVHATNARPRWLGKLRWCATILTKLPYRKSGLLAAVAC